MLCRSCLHRNSLRVRRLLAGALGCLLGGACADNKPSSSAAENPDFLRIYSLRKSSSESHPVAIEDPSRTVWYRGDQAALDLSDFLYSQAALVEGPGKQYAIDVPIHPTSDYELKSWSRQHVGDSAGIVVDGQLIQVGAIKDEIGWGIRLKIPGRDRDTLARIAEQIRAGGAK